MNIDELQEELIRIRWLIKGNNNEYQINDRTFYGTDYMVAFHDIIIMDHDYLVTHINFDMIEFIGIKSNHHKMYAYEKYDDGHYTRYYPKHTTLFDDFNC